jgi:streptogramin lyase
MSDLRERIDRELERVLPTRDARAAVDRRAARRRRHRTVLLPVVTLIVTAGLVAGLTFAFGPEPPPGPAQAASIPMPGEPIQAIVHGDALWVITQDPGCEGPACPGFVVKVDTLKGEVTGQVAVTSPTGLTAGAGSIWLASFADATLIRLDPETASIEATIPLVLPGEEPGSDWKFLPTHVAANQDGVWVSTARGAVAHIDPATNSVVDVVPLPPESLGGVVIGRDAVWLDNGGGGVIRVDPKTHQVEEMGSIYDEAGSRLSVGIGLARAGTLWALGTWGRPVEELGEKFYEATDREAIVSIEESTGDVSRIIDLPKQPCCASLLVDGDVWLVEGDGASLRRLDPSTGDLAEPIPVPFGRPLVVSGTTAWSAVGESIRRWELAPAPGEPDPAAEEDPESSRVVCDYPSTRPTYLTWLAPGAAVPEPAMEKWAEREKANQTEPGYSILTWSNGDVTNPGTARDIGSVALWRTTESVVSFPTDDEVPALPDGSTGRLNASEGGGADWSIVWGDPTPDVTGDDCSETTLVAYFPNLSKAEGKQEIIKIARSLVPAEHGSTDLEPLVIQISGPRTEDGTYVSPRFQASYLGTRIPLDAIETPGPELEYPVTESPVALPAGTSIIIEGEYRHAAVFELRHSRGGYVEEGACLIPTPLSQLPERDGPTAFFIYVEWPDASGGKAFRTDIAGAAEASSEVDGPETQLDGTIIGFVVCDEAK